ncbi:MAG: peptide deformylase [Candidatus Omnitrophica bacterium]|nr:peptide deformylase [Candidatus Omnitrophota bacterium]
MAVKRIRKYGADVLRKKSLSVKDISEKTIKLIQNLEDTLKKSRGVGLSAPQLGVLERVFIANDPDTKKIIKIINPEIVEIEEFEIDLEGCLSFPGVYFSIKRPAKITITGWTPRGKKIIIPAKGLLARCFAHEHDHLNGTLIIDYASEEEKKHYSL